MIAVEACVVSGATVRLICVPGLALSRLRVMPGTAPVTVLPALERLRPSTEKEALLPETIWPKLRPPPLPTEKLAALPEVLLTMASRAPLASVTTLAVTPRLSALMVLATSFRVPVPVPVEMVVTVPSGPVMVKLPAARGVLALATVPEAQEAVLARLLTTTT